MSKLTTYTNSDLISAVTDIDSIKNLKISFPKTLEVSLATGLCSGIGSFFLGPVGFMGAAVIGSGVGNIYKNNSFRSVSNILMYELDDEQKYELAGKIRRLLKKENIASYAELIEDESVKGSVAYVVEKFLKKTYGKEVVFLS